jgi:transposase
VISANLTRAAVEAAPVIADLSSWLADVAGKAGIAWERLFDAPEEKSLRPSGVLHRDPACQGRGIVAPQGAANVQQLILRLADPEDTCIPDRARSFLLLHVDQLRDTERRIADLDEQLKEQARQDEAAKRLMTIPGVGPVVATAITATLGDGRAFASGRHLAAWLGLVPGKRSTGGKERLIGITKAGDGYLRRLLVNGARALTRWWRSRSPWLMALLARRPVNVATVALANKMARVIWVVLVRGQVYRTAA